MDTITTTTIIIIITTIIMPVGETFHRRRPRHRRQPNCRRRIRRRLLPSTRLKLQAPGLMRFSSGIQAPWGEAKK